MNLTIPNLAHQFSFSKSLGSVEKAFLSSKLFHLSLPHARGTNKPARTLIIRMGGGPRTYPGGVSKWQWKRMQAKKAKQLLKARLSRERQIYEMRKRAELKAAVSELERPWEVVERPPNLFSVKADEQLKVLADRFQKPGGFDLWTEKDGPQLFDMPDDLPSVRFFPKGVVHSVKPYKQISETTMRNGDRTEEGSDMKSPRGGLSNVGDHRIRDLKCIVECDGGLEDECSLANNSPKLKFENERNGKKTYGRSKVNWNGKNSLTKNGLNVVQDGHLARRVETPSDRYREPKKNARRKQLKSSNPEECDMSLQQDRSYDIQ